MPKVMENLRIRAVSAALPHARTTLADVGQLFNDRDVQRIARNAGIEQVYPAGHLTMVDLCAAAARQLMEDSNIAPASIDALVVGTQSAEKSLLASSSDLARRLGLRTDVVVFDLSCTCNCYIYGLYQAACW
jgi:3-oxoacyl-[acyl-carrier-protein] synthase-3